ncbi:MAG: hypothetical protein J6C24_04945 [Clostridia bacterium]|nr:hypothetical protein [Clostridia bacterium]
MKKIFLLFLGFILTCMSCSCSSTGKYYVRTPYNEVAEEKFEAFDSLDEAKKKLEDVKQLGYVIFNSKGQVAYHPYETLAQSKVLYQAKKVADYTREKGYAYGNANVNPPYDLGKTEKLVSCDRFVAWAIFMAGYTKNNTEESRHTLYGDGNLESYLIANGFIKIDKVEEVQAGDVIFVGDSHEHYPNLQGAWLEYPDHVFICAGESFGGNFYRYDAGSDRRIQSVQPSDEPLEYSGKEFKFAYRVPEARK